MSCLAGSTLVRVTVQWHGMNVLSMDDVSGRAAHVAFLERRPSCASLLRATPASLPTTNECGVAAAAIAAAGAARSLSLALLAGERKMASVRWCSSTRAVQTLVLAIVAAHHRCKVNVCPSSVEPVCGLCGIFCLAVDSFVFLHPGPCGVSVRASKGERESGSPDSAVDVMVDVYRWMDGICSIDGCCARASSCVHVCWCESVSVQVQNFRLYK